MSKRWIAVLSVVLFLFVGFSSLTPVLASGACHVAWISADPPNGVALGQNATFTTAVFCDSGAKVGSVQISGFSTVIAAADGQTTVSGTAVMTVSGTVEIQVRVYPKGDPFSMELKTMNYTVFPKEGAATVSSPPQQAVVPTATATSSVSQATGSVIVNTEMMNLRAQPSPVAAILDKLVMGTKVTYLGQANGCDGKVWYLVQKDSTTGWLKAKLTKLESVAKVIDVVADCTGIAEVSASSPVQSAPAGTVVVSVLKVNVRAETSTESKIIGTARQGDALEYHSTTTDGTWHKVKLAGNLGWVQARFVSMGPNTVEIRPTPTPAPTLAPTAGSATIVACPGAPASRLFEQKSAKSTPDGDPLAIRILPGTDATKLGSIPNGKSVDITGAPECHGGMYWYPVTYLNISGWSAEGITEKWFLEPVGEATPEPTAVG